MVLRHAWGTAHAKSLSKWWEDDNEDEMEGGREQVYKIMSLTFLFFVFFNAILYFCPEIKFLFAIIQAPCWDDVTESYAIFPFAPAPICAPEKVRSSIISCLPCCLISSSIMQCSVHCRHIMALNIQMFLFLAGCIEQQCAASFFPS